MSERVERRYSFLGGTIITTEAYSFQNKETGEQVNVEKNVTIIGSEKFPIKVFSRHTIPAIAEMYKTEKAFKDFVDGLK